MKRTYLCVAALGACLVLLSQNVANAGDLCPPNAGPDVIVGDLWDIGGFGVSKDVGG